MVKTEDHDRHVALICGAEGVGKKILMQRLLETGEAPESTANLALDTKYYTANVTVKRRGLQDLPHLDEIEAVILAFDCARPETYHAAVSWWNSNNVRGAGISLCVANKADKLMDGEFVERPGWLEMARQWCSSELIEYIEVCASDREIDNILASSEDQQGMKRVRGALEAHVWPGLVLKQTPTIPQAVTESLTDTNTISNDEIGITSTSGPGRDLSLDGTLEESRAGSDSPSELRGQSRQDNSQDSAEAVTENAQTSNGLHGVSMAGHASPSSLREDSQGNAGAPRTAPTVTASEFQDTSNNFLSEAIKLDSEEFDGSEGGHAEANFERLLGEMVNIRGMLQGMEGEARRQAAGDLMLRMQRELGISDGETSDEE